MYLRRGYPPKAALGKNEFRKLLAFYLWLAARSASKKEPPLPICPKRKGDPKKRMTREVAKSSKYIELAKIAVKTSIKPILNAFSRVFQLSG